MKFKKIPVEYFVTILDRLTRFEPANIRYKRVFDDIINKFLLSDKLKSLSFDEEIAFVEEIFNSSLKNKNDNFLINDILTKLEDKYFYSSPDSYQYLSARLNISSMLDEIENNDNLAKNIQWLKKINENPKDFLNLRKKYSLLYPIEKIILCEGQTEFVLLETIFSLFDIDFNKLGVLVIPAGGKNQVARKYYSMIEKTKIPFFILLDKDAASIKELIEPKLRKTDDIYLINSGEFEDLIPKNLLKNAVNSIHKNEYNCVFDDFCNEISMVENINNIYKKYGFGEFKKAHFAASLKEYIINHCSKEDFLGSEIVKIIEAFNSSNQKPNLK